MASCSIDRLLWRVSTFAMEVLYPSADQEQTYPFTLGVGQILDGQAQLIANCLAHNSLPLSLKHFRYTLGQRLRKTKGSSWQGKVVGFYSTTIKPIRYATESQRELGSVQIYPEAALESVLE